MVGAVDVVWVYQAVDEGQRVDDCAALALPVGLVSVSKGAGKDLCVEKSSESNVVFVVHANGVENVGREREW